MAAMMPRHSGYESGWDNGRPSPQHTAPQGSAAEGVGSKGRSGGPFVVGWNMVAMTGTTPVARAAGSKAGQGFYLR
jgi:hypothetical protein